MTNAVPSKWQAVARAKRIGSRPLRVVVEGQPLVLFKTSGSLYCLTDRCPHRFAPLSEGRVIDGKIECPYHGWQFDGTGACRAIPGLLGEVPRVFVPSHAVCEHTGLIFVSLEKDPGIPYSGVLSGPEFVSTAVESRVSSELADVAENILDATHTHFTHRGILRGLSHRRYKVEVTVRGGDGWVEARYEGEPRQEGLISRLLEGERSISVGRFIYPGIAELEFWGRDRINLATTFYLRQEDPETVSGFGVLSGPRQGGLGYLKAVLFKPFFRIALRQDQVILRQASNNKGERAGHTRPLITALDVLRPHIDAILRGERPAVADVPVTITMEL